MKTVALIPARYDATRFAGKLMADLNGKPVIRHTYDAAVATGLFDEVMVVTDSERIYDEILTHGGKAMRSKKQHESGTDRIAEAAESLPYDLIMNIQGDTPFIKKQPLQALLEQFREPDVEVGSLMQVLEDPALVADPNYVKVCVDKKKNALFFSRSVIPFPRNKDLTIIYYEHIGVYAFRKEALIRFTTWQVAALEDAEKVECLRFLENGVNIRMVLTDYLGIEIDTPEDLEKAARLLK